MTVGVLGGGQLGRMLALAGYPLGFRFRFLDSHPEAPAEPLAELLDGDFLDHDMLDRFANRLDRVTYEFENVPLVAVRHLESRVTVRPSSRALEAAQDRVIEKQVFQSLGIPTAPFEPVGDHSQLDSAIARIGFPSLLKLRRLGYDGKGQVFLRDDREIPDARRLVDEAPCVLEGFVPFDRELSLVAARDAHGNVAAYPLVENHHREGILRATFAPAPRMTSSLERLAMAHIGRVLEHLGYIGVLTIEFFQVGETLIANEMAPRVHNSGHWTIEGAPCSQFENHLRAVADLPLGQANADGVSAMVNLIGEVPPIAELLAIKRASLHLYGKAARAGRKLGHVTLHGNSWASLAPSARALARSIQSTDPLAGAILSDFERWTSSRPPQEGESQALLRSSPQGS